MDALVRAADRRGVEGTGSYGAGLARQLTSRKATVVKVDRPDLLTRFGVGTDVVAQLLTTAGDNPDRLRSEAAALAHLCGAARIPASSGRVRRHRLHRRGGRAANHALHAHCSLPPALRPKHPRLPAATHHRWPQHARDPPLPQALRLHRPTGRLRRPRPLTSI
uniref:transposase n=1 Tax=Micromonospora echinaurantiaca TaxID=47857 RepID=UPI0038CBF7AB